MSDTSPDLSAVDVFLKSWRTYQDIIEYNYMFHREISDSVRTALVNFRPHEKIFILDLGCGDGSMTLRLVNSDRIASYIGCDLSKPALDIAKAQIKSLGIPAQLICEDMLHVVKEQPENSVDLVLCSYALHHLNANQKKHMVEQIRRILSPNGRLVLIDIFREPHEDRAAYIRNYMEHLKKTWIHLSFEAQALIVDHATTYDFPEHPEFYQTLLKKSGLSSAQRLAKHTWHEAWLAINRIEDSMLRV